MIGQRVPCQRPYAPAEAELATWRSIQQGLKAKAQAAFSIEEALTAVRSPDHRWPTDLYTRVEGLIRVTLFVSYLTVISLLPDLRRVFQYHAAEHKAINAYEAGEELTPKTSSATASSTRAAARPSCSG